MEKTETPAGIFTIDRYEFPEKYIPSEKAEIKYLENGYVRIVTMDQEVEWKDQKFTPVVYQSCMHPDQITVYPLEIVCAEKEIIFRDHYHEGRWNEAEGKIQIQDWYPRLKKGGCFPCQNCGRC